jgi:hypothetical protein
LGVGGGPCWMRWQSKTELRGKTMENTADLPVKLARLVLGLTVELRLSALGLAVADLLVDVDVFADRLLLGAAALFFVDADLFLDVSLAGRLLVLVLVDGGREGFVRLFVTFPSVCLRLR